MEAYIVEAVRTPRGKAGKSLAQTKAVALIAPLFEAVLKRTGLDPKLVDNLILGCNTATGDQGANLARVSALYSGWGEHIPGATINRYCCSGLDACNLAAAAVSSGSEDLVLAGGVESLSRVPIFSDRGAWFADPEVAAKTRFIHMGIAADLLATLEGYERSELDDTALLSHERADLAHREGRFKRALVPITDSDGKLILDHDEAVRANLSREKVTALKPSFTGPDTAAFDALALSTYPQLGALDHLHHPGTSPALTDGASLLLLASKAAVQRLGLKPMARLSSYANATCEPVLMLTAHITATRKLLERSRLKADQIDLFEVNESFAASALKYRRELDVPLERFNVNGGALAMGHPLGATGGILITTLLDALRAGNLKRGIAAIPGGAGVGVATLIERMDS